jgi:hypothetical protein
LIPTALPTEEPPDSPADKTKPPAGLETDEPVSMVIVPELPSALSPVATERLPVSAISDAAADVAEAIIT